MELGCIPDKEDLDDFVADLGDLMELTDEDWASTLEIFRALHKEYRLGARAHFVNFGKLCGRGCSKTSTDAETVGNRVSDIAKVTEVEGDFLQRLESICGSAAGRARDRQLKNFCKDLVELSWRDPLSAKWISMQAIMTI